MLRLWLKREGIIGALALVTFMPLAVAAFQDPLEMPATHSALAVASPLTAIAPAGDRLVAVGPRGHILYSDDGGRQWTQALVPVSSDLVAVHFPTPDKGWAVGHDGVILHSTDGGHNWVKQLDGRAAAQLMVDFYTNASQSSSPEAERALTEAQHFAEQGPVHPFLDVWFESDQVGFVIGAFGLAFATRDGGKSWVPWFDRMDNPSGLHLYGIRGADGRVYAVGEQGLILRLDRDKQRFVAVPGPYQGTYFGVVMSGEAIIVFGMRGNAFRSTDAGKTWSKVDTHASAGLTGGVALKDGRVVLVSQGGHVLVSADRGATFATQPVSKPAAHAGVAAVSGTGIAMVGSQGIGLESLK